MNILRLLHPERRASSEMVERFASIPVANISDVMQRIVAAGPRIRPMHAGGVLCGPAFTVKTRPGDNLVIHKALDAAKPGDIVVVDAGGDLTNSLMGEMMLSYAERLGLGGVVLNGAIRDSAYVRSSKFPVFAAGITHRGPYKDGPGEMNIPIAVDGMVIEPGDLLVGDDDGLVCVPFDALETVYRDAIKKNEAENRQMSKILSGEYGVKDRVWVDQALEATGFEIVTSRV